MKLQGYAHFSQRNNSSSNLAEANSVIQSVNIQIVQHLQNSLKQQSTLHIIQQQIQQQ